MQWVYRASPRIYFSWIIPPGRFLSFLPHPDTPRHCSCYVDRMLHSCDVEWKGKVQGTRGVLVRGDKSGKCVQGEMSDSRCYMSYDASYAYSVGK